MTHTWIKTNKSRCCQMKSTKTVFQIIMAILILVAGVLIWYFMSCLQNPDVLMDATLVLRSNQV